MKAFFLSALVCAAAVSSAADLTLSIDTKAPARPSFPHGAPCVGYATDPQAGGEEAAVACRRAGAWLFRTALCDDATLTAGMGIQVETGNSLTIYAQSTDESMGALTATGSGSAGIGSRSG